MMTIGHPTPTTFETGDVTRQMVTVSQFCNDTRYMVEWEQLNFTVSCLDGKKQRALVHKYFGTVYMLPIMYADVARFLALYERGGWYIDTDVRAGPAVYSFKPNTTTLGLEFDIPHSQARERGLLHRSIATWAMFGEKNDQRLLQVATKLIENVQYELRAAGEPTYNYELRTTGPSAVTNMWKNLSGTVLGIEVFGCGQLYRNSPRCSTLTCWCCHYFDGTWVPHKTWTHHPIY